MPSTSLTNARSRLAIVLVNGPILQFVVRWLIEARNRQALTVLEMKPHHQSIADFVAELKRSWIARNTPVDQKKSHATNSRSSASMIASLLNHLPSLLKPYRVLQSISLATHPQIEPSNIQSLLQKSLEQSRLASKSVATICRIIQSTLEVNGVTDEQRKRELEETTELLRWAFEIWMNELDRSRVYQEICGVSERGKGTIRAAETDVSALVSLLDSCVRSITSPGAVKNIQLVDVFLSTIPLCSSQVVGNKIASSVLRTTAMTISKISQSLRWTLDGSHIHTKLGMEAAQLNLHRVHRTLLSAFELWIPAMRSEEEKRSVTVVLEELEVSLRESLDGYRVEDRIGVEMEAKLLRLLELVWTRIEGLKAA